MVIRCSSKWKLILELGEKSQFSLLEFILSLLSFLCFCAVLQLWFTHVEQITPKELADGITHSSEWDVEMESPDLIETLSLGVECLMKADKRKSVQINT